MTEIKNDEIYENFCARIGESEDSNWTEYTTEIVAKTILIDFKEPHWKRLESEILSRPEYWQQRCAVSMGENRTEHAINILKLLLLNSNHIDVKTISIYELDWAEVKIEEEYANLIKEVITKTPPTEIEPELQNLLLKAESN